MDAIRITPKDLSAVDNLQSEADKTHITTWAKEILNGAPYISASFARDPVTKEFGAPEVTWADCTRQYDKNLRRYYEWKVGNPEKYRENLGKWVAFFSDGSVFLYKTAGAARGDREDRKDPDAFVVCVGYDYPDACAIVGLQ